MKHPGPIILIGFKGCGKSTIGRALAKKLGREFLDTDTMIEDLHRERMQQELDFRGIYLEHGHEYFDSLEMEALRHAFELTGAVISFGGGAAMKLASAGTHTEDAVFVYITVAPDVLYERIMRGGMPAFFDKRNPRASFDKLLEKRKTVYEDYATVTVDNSGDDPDTAVAEIMDALEEL